VTGLSLLALLALLAWAYLLALHGRFWLAGPRLDAPVPPAAGDLPSVVAVVPARNEADVVGEAVAGLLAQDYAGPFRILLVDDHSEDGTAEAARTAAADDARVTVLPAGPRPPGWVGKLWARACGCQAAGEGADYWWFTDADIAHAPDTLSRLVAEARRGGRSQVSLMVLLSCRSAWEKLLIPAFVFFFQMLYPFHWVTQDRGGASAAAGGCMLVRADDFAVAGGLPAMRDALIDDCTLAQRLRPGARAGGRGLYLGLTLKSRSIRPYEGLDEIWRMVARSAYTQLQHSPLFLAGTLAGMALLYLLPPLLVLGLPAHGDWGAALLGLAAWLSMAVAWLPTLRLYGLPVWRGALLPAAAAFYTAMTFDSARRHWQGRGAAWKGRIGAGRTPQA